VAYGDFVTGSKYLAGRPVTTQNCFVAGVGRGGGLYGLPDPPRDWGAYGKYCRKSVSSVNVIKLREHLGSCVTESGGGTVVVGGLDLSPSLKFQIVSCQNNRLSQLCIWANGTIYKSG